MSSDTSFNSIQSSFDLNASKLAVEGLDFDKFMKEMNEILEKKLVLTCSDAIAGYDIQSINSIKQLSEKV